MAVVVRVLMLAACGPLLLPPGYCLCKAGVGSRGTARPQEPGSGPQSQPPATRSTCCSHRHPATAGGVDHRQTVTDTPLAPGPTPHDDSHLPGCPASPGVDRYKWTEPTPPSAAVLSPPLTLPLDVPLEPAPHRPLTAAETNRASAPPLYLSHCALVI